MELDLGLMGHCGPNLGVISLDSAYIRPIRGRSLIIADKVSVRIL